MIEQRNLLGEAGASRRRQRWWVVAKTGKGTVEVLTTNVDGKKILPIFSFEEEADLFCRFQVRDGCRVRETSPGELVSILCGPCASVKTLTLDPLPEIYDREMIRLVSVSRENFVRTLLARIIHEDS